jgi:hypothetical protein
MRTQRDIAWLAGLFEGEASFLFRNGSARIQMQMTDRDVVERSASVLGARMSDYVRQPKGKTTYKKVYTLGVHGALAVSWMMTIYSYMGERRKSKIRDVLLGWRACRPNMRGTTGGRALCHPERAVVSFGKCKRCYHKEYMRAYRKGSPRRSQQMATCHPDRKHRARGFCEQCYIKDWSAQWKVA